ncbi:MAG: type IV pili methyl-accepting chemotaxis transducer N-terminal domain-containing protein [Alphaproteobacteria bacterium]
MTIFKNFSIKIFVILLAIFIPITVFSSDESAQNLNYMRTLRYFSQTIANEVLIINLKCDFPATSKIYGYKSEVNPERLRIVVNLFERLLNSFINGDPELNIKLLNNSKWRVCVNDLNNKWEKIFPLIKIILNNNEAGSPIVNNILDAISLIFNQANECVKILDDNNSPNIRTTIKNLYSINQALTKNFYTIAFRKNIEEEQATAKQLLNLFDNYMKAFQKGSKELSITQSIDPDIQAQINKIDDLWNKQKSLIETAIYADQIPKYKLTEMVALNLNILDQIDALSKIY